MFNSNQMIQKFSTQIDQMGHLSKKILLVEHDMIKRNNLVVFLRQLNHDVVVAEDGFLALELINSQSFDLFLIDKMLPYNDAFTLYGSIKNKNLNVPVIFLTESGDFCNEIHIEYTNFEKRFLPLLKEMIRKSLNNDEKTSQEVEIYKIGAFTLNPTLRILQYADGKSTKLTPKENKLLKLLITNNYKLVHKQLLHEKVWYNDERISYKTMNVYVSRLRKILRKDKNIRITNIYKTGFILSD